MFVDPANGDFRVKPGSPALELGFKNFPMDQFGVKKPALRAIARTPVIPELGVAAPPHRGAVAKSVKWQGVSLSALTGEQFSAYGVSQEDGGVALSEVKPASAAAKLGFREGDLIQGINGRKIVTMKHFQRVIRRTKGAVTFHLVRDQQVMELKANL